MLPYVRSALSLITSVVFIVGCGSHDAKRVTFVFLRAFPGEGMVKQEDLYEKCYELYKVRQDQAPG